MGAINEGATLERLTAEQFEASRGSASGLSIEGARRVLVDGESVRGAATKVGVSNTAVQAAIDRVLKKHYRALAGRE